MESHADMQSNATSTGVDVDTTETLGGHVRFGIVPLILGTWWIFNVCCRYQTAKKFQVPFCSSTWFIWNRFPNTPVEPWVMFVSCLVVSIVEIVGTFDNGQFNMPALLHCMLYLVPFMASITQLVRFYKNWMFPDLDYYCWMLSFLMQGFIIRTHLHGRLPVNNMLHIYISYVMYGAAIAVFLESVFKDKPIFALLRGMFTFQIGLNIIRIGLLIYPLWEPVTWDLHSHRELNKALLGFCAEFVFMIIVAILINGFVYRRYSVDKVYMAELLKNGHVVENGHRKATANGNLNMQWNEKSVV